MTLEQASVKVKLFLFLTRLNLLIIFTKESKVFVLSCFCMGMKVQGYENEWV